MFVLCFGVFVFVFVSVLCTSYVNMLVLAVAVSHSPAREVTSSPQESWLKNRGWPGDGHDGQDLGHDGHDDDHDGRDDDHDGHDDHHDCQDNDHDGNFDDSNVNVKKVGGRKDNIESMGLSMFVHICPYLCPYLQCKDNIESMGLSIFAGPIEAMDSCHS